MPNHSRVISILERVKQETGRIRNLKKRIHELTRNLNKGQRQTPLHNGVFDAKNGVVRLENAYFWRDNI